MNPKAVLKAVLPNSDTEFFQTNFHIQVNTKKAIRDSCSLPQMTSPLAWYNKFDDPTQT
jgi:hypothetical protein